MPPTPVADLCAFVPAKDFELSQRFYADLGFTRLWGNLEVAQFEVGRFRFLLQNFYVQAWAENFMMSLAVDDADAWWEHIQQLDLQRKYGLGTAKAPAVQPWGLRVLYLSDPSGVLWHINDRRV
jgi:uncharacterized glyoxalase superfamily protein PhnB